MLTRSPRSALILSIAGVLAFTLTSAFLNLALPYWLSGDIRSVIADPSSLSRPADLLALAAILLAVAAGAVCYRRLLAISVLWGGVLWTSWSAALGAVWRAAGAADQAAGLDPAARLVAGEEHYPGAGCFPGVLYRSLDRAGETVTQNK